MKWILVLFGVISVSIGKLSAEKLYDGKLKEDCMEGLLVFRKETATGTTQENIHRWANGSMKSMEDAGSHIAGGESEYKKLKFQKTLKFGPVANMKKISWDDNLAKSAAESLEKCPSEGGRASGDHREAVVDITAASNGQRLRTMITDSFFGLYRHMMTVSPADNPEAVVGEFYWADREKVGCAVKKCDQQTRLLCHLGPGNSVKGDPFIVGEPCSKCPDGYSCEDKFCAKKEKVVETVKDSGSVESSSNKAERYGFGVMSLFIISVVSIIL